MNESGYVKQPFDMPGQYFDVETGYDYNWHRYYDATAGRYLRADPVNQIPSIKMQLEYTYAFANPLRLRDQKGLATVDWSSFQSNCPGGCGFGKQEQLLGGIQAAQNAAANPQCAGSFTGHTGGDLGGLLTPDQGPRIVFNTTANVQAVAGPNSAAYFNDDQPGQITITCAASTFGPGFFANTLIHEVTHYQQNQNGQPRDEGAAYDVGNTCAPLQ
jgi:RHS repeat-associated protein